MAQQKLWLEGEGRPRELDVVQLRASAAHLAYEGQWVDLSIRLENNREGLWAQFSDKGGWVWQDPKASSGLERRPIGLRWFFATSIDATRIDSPLYVNGTGQIRYLLNEGGRQIEFSSIGEEDVIALDDLPESGRIIPDDIPDAGGDFRFIVDEKIAKQANLDHVGYFAGPLLNERGEAVAYRSILDRSGRDWVH